MIEQWKEMAMHNQYSIQKNLEIEQCKVILKKWDKEKEQTNLHVFI